MCLCVLIKCSPMYSARLNIRSFAVDIFIDNFDQISAGRKKHWNTYSSTRSILNYTQCIILHFHCFDALGMPAIRTKIIIVFVSIRIYT